MGKAQNNNHNQLSPTVKKTKLILPSSLEHLWQCVHKKFTESVVIRMELHHDSLAWLSPLRI
jgi:hypothetical protein